MLQTQNWSLIITLIILTLYLADVAARPHPTPGIQSAGDR